MAEKDPMNFSHLVLFWMNDPANDDERAKLEEGLKKLVATSEYVKYGQVGKPAGTDRPVVDNSYDFSLLVTFESSEDHDKYQVEPAHKTFIEGHNHIWSRVSVVDSISL